MAREIFICKRCGLCCKGSGGIVLQAHDLARIAHWLDEDEMSIVEKWAEKSAGKLRLRIGDDGYCVFFDRDKGCGIHAAKPDICRAWPFFRGNLVDPASLEMARDFCAGIDKKVDFAEFRAAGLQYIMANNLCAADVPGAPNALRTGHLTDQSKR